MSREFVDDPTHPVIELMNEQRDIVDKGGTMRLGAYPCELMSATLAYSVYGEAKIEERHRHRFEVNPAYHARLADGGLIVSGWSPDHVLAEIVEIKDHPWFLGCQFHPEFKSRPLEPHPLFSSYIKSAVEYQHSVRNNDRSQDNLTGISSDAETLSAP
jgi:CTP synthase